MNKNELSAGTKDEQRTAAESGTSASLVQNGMLGAVMVWNKIENGLPPKEGFYECYLPENKRVYEHHAEYWFDGKDFLDGDTWKIWTDTRFHGKSINKYISHWMKIVRPV
jgi:hypothetical protein